MNDLRRCAYGKPTTHKQGVLLRVEEFHRGQYYCKPCQRAEQVRYREEKKSPVRSPVASRSNGELPTPLSEEDTTPGIPPPSLIDGTPDFAVYATRPTMAFSHRLLAIGDLHTPRQHPDALEFLAAVKQEFDPDCVVQVGDETDFHGLSFHDRDPDLPGPSDELRLARLAMDALASLFPIMTVIESNHGSLLYRKALASGIPSEMLKGYNDVLQVGAGWRWVTTHTVDTKSGPVHLEHGQKTTARTMSRRLGMSCIQGHRHSESYAEWWDNSIRPAFAAQTGCLIANNDRGFWYNRQYREHPVMSSVVVVDGEPYVIRLAEKKSGRWDARLAVTRAAS